MSSSSGEITRSELAAGTILQNRYRVVRPLGKGGMGAVYEALDLRLDATVALKETFSTDDQLRKQFEREARMLAHLHHPSLPRVSDYFTEGDRAFLVMQFIEGVDLACIMTQQPGPFPLDRVVAWADQLLDALIYLHSRDRQVIHRDIKPHNLKLTPQGQLALLDFGLAKAQPHKSGEGTSSAAIYGYTKQYAPLEQIQDLATGPQSDIYALGATLYHLLTGLKPPDALARATALVQSRPDPLRPANEVHWAIGPEIAAILKRAMAQSADDRYASASDFRNALWQVGRTGVAARIPVVQVASVADETVAAVLPGAAPGVAECVAAPQKGTTYRARAVAAAAILFFAATAAVFLRSGSPSAEIPGVNPSPPSTKPARLFGAATRSSKPDRPSTKPNEPASNSRSMALGGSPTDKASKEIATLKLPTPIVAGPSPATAGALAHSRLLARTQREALRALKAPNIRLPTADLQGNYPAAIQTSSATNEPPASYYGSPTETRRPAPTSETREAQILRARDGTQIIKLPDGSTRVFRPGERSN